MSSRVSASWRSAFGRGLRLNELLGFVVAWFAVGAIGFPPDVARGATITVGGLITVTADDGASFKTGDTFTYSFSFDDQTVDTASETFNARFNAGVSAFSLSRGAANVGTWDPAGGTFAVAPVMNFIAGANSDAVTIQANGSGFPAINGQPFFDVGLTFSFRGVRDFVDTGSGQTFAQVVGVSPLDFATASSTFAEIRNTDFVSPVLTMTVVPEPSTNAMALAALACGGYLVRRSRKRTGRTSNQRDSNPGEQVAIAGLLPSVSSCPRHSARTTRLTCPPLPPSDRDNTPVRSADRHLREAHWRSASILSPAVMTFIH